MSPSNCSSLENQYSMQIYQLACMARTQTQEYKEPTIHLEIYVRLRFAGNAFQTGKRLENLA